MRGQFLVVAQQIELQNLTADFELLRKIAATTGGTFHPVNAFNQLQQKLYSAGKSIIRTEERYDSLINPEMDILFAGDDDWRRVAFT